MKKMVLSLTLCLSLFDLLSAKNVKGIVMDNFRQPIEFVNVSAFKGDSIVGGCITDSIGEFSLTLPDMANLLHFSFVGYEPKDVPISSPNVGEVILTPTTTILKDVTVTAPMIRREADRIILNVAANPLAANKDAQELLKTSPGVWATDNALSIYGQDGTTVYINDNKVNLNGTQLMTYLKSVQSSAISSIEIIPNGGAEYSASSSGGIIRINLKKNRVEGINGALGINATGGEYKTWLNPFANVSLHNGKWTFNLSGNLNGSPRDRYTSYENSSNSVLSTYLEGASRHRNKTVQGNITLGAFYQVNDCDLIGLQFDYNPDKSKRRSESSTLMTGKESNITSGLYVNDYIFHNCNVALNWHHKLGGDGSLLKWISNYNFQRTESNEDNCMSWSGVPQDSVYTSHNVNRYNIFTTELSILKNLPKNWKLNAGVKYTYNNMHYTSLHHYLSSSQWINNTRYDYNNSFVEHIGAIFITANGQTGRWKYKAGLRSELYNIVIHGDNSTKLDIFPNANLSYSLTSKGDYSVSLGYYRRIRRPSFWSLSPIVRQVSDYSYTVGNPNLKPSYSDAISLDFILANKFTIAAGYSHTSDAIRQMFVNYPEHPERMYLTWKNEGKIHNAFLHGDGRLQLRSWWTLYASATYVVERQKVSMNSEYETTQYVQLVGSTTFILPKGFNFTVNCFYNSSMTIGNIKVYPLLNLNPTLQKRIGKNWNFSLGAENILQRKSKIHTQSSGYERLTFTKTYATVKLGITYTFNSGKRFRSSKIEKNIDTSRLNKDYE